MAGQLGNGKGRRGYSEKLSLSLALIPALWTRHGRAGAVPLRLLLVLLGAQHP